jgi:hypothetical protein
MSSTESKEVRMATYKSIKVTVPEAGVRRIWARMKKKSLNEILLNKFGV